MKCLINGAISKRHVFQDFTLSYPELVDDLDVRRILSKGPDVESEKEIADYNWAVDYLLDNPILDANGDEVIFNEGSFFLLTGEDYIRAIESANY
jgi:hypothetical protein